MTTILNPFGRADRACVAALGIAVAIVLTTLWATGGLVGSFAPDSDTYLEAFHSRHHWDEMRHPLYGMLASWLGADADHPGHIVLIQALLAAVAAVALYAGARSGGVGALAALTLSLAALFSQSSLFHVRLVLPESPAITCLLLAFAGTGDIVGARCGKSRRSRCPDPAQFDRRAIIRFRSARILRHLCPNLRRPSVW